MLKEDNVPKNGGNALKQMGTYKHKTPLQT